MFLETLRAGLAVEFFMGMALYAAIYLSFVRLLRFPRNWLSISLSPAFTTAVLMIITAVYVSVSHVGFDPFALVASVGIIGVLFCIIAAPAIAFQPALRWVEFMAKHCNYAGLYIILPAGFAAYAVPNVKLLGLLSAVAVIEVVWFIRHRPNNRRPLHPIVDYDLSVLKAQAGGDIKNFARRHGIDELVLSEGAFSWRGCSADTLPCPFNLYVNRLGLNTAPCCREHLAELCHSVAICLKDMDVTHWLEGGSLLGAVRERGQILAWEDDVDVSVVLDSGRTFDQLAAGISAYGEREGLHVDAFKNEGLISISFDRPQAWPFSWERNRMRGEIRLDLAVYEHALSFGEAVLERKSPKAAMSKTESGGFGLAREIVLPTSTIDFAGGNIACPNKPLEYLSALYGDIGEVVYTYVDEAAAETRCRPDTTEAAMGTR